VLVNWRGGWMRCWGAEGLPVEEERLSILIWGRRWGEAAAFLCCCCSCTVGKKHRCGMRSKEDLRAAATYWIGMRLEVRSKGRNFNIWHRIRVSHCFWHPIRKSFEI
jgi:hypothetical protein